MWYVNKLFEQAQVESLSGKSFLVRSSGGVVRIEKHGCGAELRRIPAGRYQMTIIPSIMIAGQFTRLWDAGYQKFLLTNEGRKFPIRVTQLADLRRFNEELRSALNVPTYYNEALGSTCHYSVYDRVKGRRGDVPDESVGAHEEAGALAAPGRVHCIAGNPGIRPMAFRACDQVTPLRLRELPGVQPWRVVENTRRKIMAQVLALIDDLFFQAKLAETAKHVGVELRTCTTADALMAEIAREKPKLVVVDLNARQDPLAAVERLRDSPQAISLILGFLSHGQVDLAQRARQAGCHDVMPRSKFTQQLATILAQVKSQS